MTKILREVRLPMAEPIGGIGPEPVRIVIADKIKNFDEFEGGPGNTLDKVRIYYDDQACALADALMDSLPQGIIEPLTIHLMKRRVSLYVMAMPKPEEV